ncbi:MAG: heparinase II/III family protein, partial [Phycisphaerae bacterium]|nr:heparinase II/III family protein [Phycisphaerae bacterium]
MTTRNVTVLSLSVLLFSALLIASCSDGDSQGLVACWKFDEGKGNRLLDTSGNGNHGTIHGATWTKGRVGGGLRFDGVDDYVEVLKSASLNGPKKEITLMCWIKIPPTGKHTILERWPYGQGQQRCLQLDVDTDRKRIHFVLSPHGDIANWHRRPWLIQADVWAHIAATSDGKTIRVYVDGRPDPSPLALNDPRIHSSKANLHIGIRHSTSDTWKDFFKGSMDEIRIYSRALTHEEILEHYRFGCPKGTVTGKVVDADGKPIREVKVRAGLFGTTTDREGRYKITVPAESYEVVISRKGYQREMKADVAVGEGEVMEMNASLTEDNTPPSISGVKIKDIDDLNATVVWKTDEACTGTLKYGTSSGKYDKVLDETSYAKSYRIPLTGLVPDTKYYFTVEGEDKGENTSKSKEQTFSTLPFETPRLVARRTENLTKILLKRLDLDRPGLEKVKAAADDPAKAANELLAYYRARKSVKHFVNRADRAKSLGKYATGRDLRIADDALKHIFYGSDRGKDIDWTTNPSPNPGLIWTLNNMRFWGAMSKAYWHTGDEKYAREWCFQLRDWARKNPVDREYHVSTMPWRRIEAGMRGRYWMDLYQRFLDSPSFTPEVLVTFLNSCYDHASYLVEHFTRQNHGLFEAEGAGFIAIMFPEFKDAKGWLDKVIRHQNEQIKIQVRPDGHQIEQAINYHDACLNMLSRTHELAKMNGLTETKESGYAGRLEKMAEVLMKLSLPDGSSAVFGDTKSPMRLRRNLAKWADVFGRKDFLYVATAGAEGTEPKQTAYALSDSGFYSMRSGWDENAVCLVLKCGPGGFFHCQPDNGTFELYAAGRRLMPDSGTYVYHGNPAGRNWFRQTRVHQTLTLDGKNSAFKPAQRLWKT